MAGRTYDQHCPVAVALDVVGERWALLVVRELLFGERRFTDLRNALPSIAPNLLTERLRQLEEAGLVERRELPPPAARQVYALTDDGKRLSPVVRELARFGSLRMPAPTRPVERPAGIAWGVIASWFDAAASDRDLDVNLVVDGQPYGLRIEGGRLRNVRPDDLRPGALVIAGAAAAFLDVRQGRSTLTAAKASGALEIAGTAVDRKAFERAFRLLATT